MREEQNTRVKDALGYIEHGWALAPLYGYGAQGCDCSQGDGCNTPSKHPVITGWRDPDNQITTPRQVERVWGPEGDSNRNIAIITGTPSGIFAVDIDPKNGGTDALKRLEEDHQQLPYTRVHKTGSGGKHYLFRMPENQDISNSNRNLKDAGYGGIDIRGTGGYIVAPSSVTNKGDYRVTVSAPVSEAPAWLLVLLLTPKAASGPKIDRTRVGEYETFPDAVKGKVDAYCTAALDRELNRFRDEYDLEGWDDLTNSVSFSTLMLANSPWNNLDPGDVAAKVENYANVDEGFPVSRVIKCINSAWNAIERSDLIRDVPADIKRDLEPKTVSKLGPEAVKVGERTTKLTGADSITMKRGRWLWKGRIAVGTLALVAGQAGLGKSTFVYWLVAQLTRGTLFGEYEGVPKSVIICATEDSWEYTIVPRLVAAGADRSRVFRVDVSVGDDNEDDGLNLIKDKEALTLLAREHDIGLLVLDPLTSRLGDQDTHKDSDVRKALEPMCKVAEAANFALIGIMHHNKSQGGGSGDPLRSVMGSTAFGAVARSVHTVIPEPPDENGDPSPRRILGTVKNNLGSISGAGLNTWAFKIVTEEFDTEDDDPQKLSIGKLEWDGNVDSTVADMMSQQNNPGASKPNKTAAAIEFLENLFSKHGPVLRSYVIDTNTNNLFGERFTEGTLKNAMKNERFAIKGAWAEGTKGKISYWGFAEDIAAMEES
jgi:hypothetical protein